MRLHIPYCSFAKKAWVPFSGVLVVGVLAWGLSLEGAAVPGGSNSGNRALSVSALDAQSAVARPVHSTRISTIPRDQYRIGPTHYVDWRNDIGTLGRQQGRWTGPIPGPYALREDGGVASIGGPCTFSIDCDDGNPCTNDFCDIAAGGGAGSGECVNDPVPTGQQLGDCDDGVFCNGLEICSGGNLGTCEGVCLGGSNNGVLCVKSNAGTGCPDGTCTSLNCVGGPTPTAVCDRNEDCSNIVAHVCIDDANPCVGGEVCSEDYDFCQPGNCTLGSPSASCSTLLGDTDVCTVEDCVVLGGANVCRQGAPPCGLEAACQVKQCAGCGPDCNGGSCETNADCPGGTCNVNNPPTSGCKLGRCCTGTTCSKTTAANCAANDWYATDNGQLTAQAACPACPLYEAGIGDDDITAIVGPSSLSPALNVMSGTTLRKIGDDYNFCGSGPYMSLTNLRFVGGVSDLGNSRTAFELYDNTGVFIEDLFFITNENDLSVQNVIFLVPLTIPCNGFIVAHVLQNFAQTIVARGEFFWAATNGQDPANPSVLGTTIDQGSNVTGSLIVETDLDWSQASPPVPVATFVKVCLGGLKDGVACSVNANCDSGTCQSRPNDVLAFELEGPIVTEEPLGACCKDGVIGCNEETAWNCGSVDGSFLGVNTKCAACVGGSNPGGACRTCDGGPNNNLECVSKDDCSGGTCIPDDAECPGGTCVPTTLCNTGACCLISNGDCVLGLTLATCTTANSGDDSGFQGFGVDCYPNCCAQPLSEYTGADNCEDSIPTIFGNVAECVSAADGTLCAGGKGVCRTGTSGKECYVTITGNNAGASSTIRRCIGGSNPGHSCAQNADCRLCVGGVNFDDPCTNNGECPGSTCGIAGGVCSSQVCEGGVNNTLSCDSGDDCPGGICSGNPDSCSPPSPTPGGELGWWESFSIDDCAFVRLDSCCTDPDKIPSYRIIYDQCPCGQTVFAKRDPNLSAEPPDARGIPYCDEDNAWGKYGPLAAGTYYYPELSFLGGQFSRYQLHITVKPCPDAACCYNACSNSSNTTGCVTDENCAAGEDCVNNSTNSGTVCKKLCKVNANCGGANTCDPTCGQMNQLECEDIGGSFLAPPNRAAALTTCGTVCNLGSCCTGPGECVDETVPIVPGGITKAECDNVIVGSYVGGLLCFGGTCTGGSRDGLSCGALSQCPGGTACTGVLTQLSPCPVCEIAAGDNCQEFDDSVGTRLSDLTVVGGVRAADDIKGVTSIGKVCVWGTYTAPSPGNPAITDDCGDDVTDNFYVAIYESNSLGLPMGGVPLAERNVTGADVARAHQFPTSIEDILQYRVFGFQLELDPPITGLNANSLYWIEVRNDTNIPLVNSCAWSWMTVDALKNDYSAAGGGVASASYGLAGGRTGDLAFCLDTNFINGGEIVRGCCDCNEACTLTNKRDCDGALSSWNVNNLACSACSPLPPANDNCVNVVGGAVTPDGSFLWDNHCTTTDGPNPTPTELSAGETQTNDVWYKYVAAEDGSVVFSTCPSGSSDGGGVDSMIGAYLNPAARGTCSCPTQANHINRLFPGGEAFDENCTGILAGAGAFVAGPVLAGDCFMVRVGGFGGQGGEQGQGTVVFELTTVGGQDPPTLGDFCLGGGVSVNGNPCTSDGNCPGGVCGSTKSRYISVKPALPSVAGGTTSIQLQIVSAKQCSGGTNNLRGCEVNAQCLGGGTCVNSPQIGDIWWAGPEVCLRNDPQDDCIPPGPTSLRGSQVLCSATPANAQVWTTGTLSLFGGPIVPFASYNVRTCDAAGDNCSDPLLLTTGEWGDAVAPFTGAGQPNFGDINEVIFKFRTLSGTQPMTRVDFVGTGNPGQANIANQVANFNDISACVEGFRFIGYPGIIPVCNP